MGKSQVKVVKVSASSTRGFWTRSFFQPSMDKVIEKWMRKGWRHTDTTPVANSRGKTTHYLLKFERG